MPQPRLPYRCLPTRKASLLALLFGAWLWSFTPPCGAQTDPDDLARRHFESGAAYFEQAEYEEALREFNKSYELSQRPQILRNVSIVQERLGNLAAAVEALDAYLAQAPNDPDIDTVRIRRDNLKKRLEEEKEEAAPPPVVEEPKVKPRPTEPAPRHEPPPEDNDSAAFDDGEFASDGDGEPSLVPAYVFLTVGGLAAAGSAVTGFLAAEEFDALEAECGGGCTDEEVSTGENLALTSTVLTGAAVVGIGVGVIWWAVAGSSDEASSAPATRTAKRSYVPGVHVEVGRDGGYGEAVWRF